MRTNIVSACVWLGLAASVGAQGLDLELLEAPGEDLLDIREPAVLLYVPFDGDAVALTPEYKISPWGASEPFADGLRGRALMLDGSQYVGYPTADVLDRARGTLLFWVRRTGPAADVPDGFSLVEGEPGVPGSAGAALRDGDWHCCALTWNPSDRKRTAYFDGRPVDDSPLQAMFAGPKIKIGQGFEGLLDELYVLSEPLASDDIARAYEAGRAGRTPWPAAEKLTPPEFRYPVAIATLKQKRPPLPPGVNWDLSLASETLTRKRYALSGYWRVQPLAPDIHLPTIDGNAAKSRVVSLKPGEAPWLYTPVPGSWRPHNENRNEGGSFDERLKAVDKLRNIPLSNYTVAWLERDFEVPADRRGDAVFIVIEGVHDGTAFYVNDEYVGWISPWQSVEFEVTARIRTGAPNRISLMAGKPYYPTHSSRGETLWLPSGPCLPVCVEFRGPGAPAVRDVWPRASFRDKALDVEFHTRHDAAEPMTLTAECRIRDPRGDRTFSLGRRPFTLSQTTSGAAEKQNLRFAWDDPILWFPDDPHLLWLSLIVRDGETVLDETPPVRFGFREVWAEDGQLRMNGVPFRMHGQCHSFGGLRPVVEEQIRRLGLIGMRSSVGGFIRAKTDYPETVATLDVCDEQGFLLAYALFAGPTEEAMRSYFRVYGTHPSVVAFARREYGYDSHPHGSPIAMGRAVSEDETEAPEYRRNRAYVDLAHEVHPGCLVGYYQQGVVGDFRSYMQYQGYGTPLQSREEWPRYWAGQRPAPFIGMELDICSSLYLSNWQKASGFGSNPGAGAGLLCTEHAARYFGDAAYERESRAYVEALRARDRHDKGAASPNVDELKALFVKQTLRSWRTYGLSFFLLDDTEITYRGDLTLGAMDRAYRDNNQAFLAYIGGGPDDFVTKDHAYWAGETVRKQVIVINGRFRPVDAEVTWRVVRTDSGELVAERTARVAAEAGDILHRPLEFQAPDVSDKTVCRIELTVREGGEVVTDVVAVEVFPRAAAPDMGGARVAALDKTGSAAAILRMAGIPFTALEWDGTRPESLTALLEDTDLLVIGRQSCPTNPGVQSALFGLAEEGLTILCLEQSSQTVFGLRNDDPNTRHAFISARGHELVRGLDDADFRNWRGASNLLEPYPDYREGVEYGYLDHHKARGCYGQNEYAHWSANGTVASFHLEKPQAGRFQAILSSGFDMLYSPLLELDAGAGRVVLCQLDVSSRYGIDPAATLIVNRLLNYASRAAARPGGPIGYWGSDYWAGVLDELHAGVLRLDRVPELQRCRVAMIGLGNGRLDPEEKPGPPGPAAAELKIEDEGGSDAVAALLEEVVQQPAQAGLKGDVKERAQELQRHKAEIASFLAQGGVLIVPCAPSAAALQWLPFEVGVDRGQTFSAPAGGAEDLSGLTAADFFYREVLDVPLVSDVPQGAWLQPGGLVAVVHHGRGKAIFCQVSPGFFEQAWQRTKALRVWATLLGNNGVPSRRPAAGENALTGFFYAAPALDFNPDKHRSW